MDKLIEYFVKTLDMIHTSDRAIISEGEIKKIEDDLANFSEKSQNQCLIICPQVITVAKN